MAELPERGFVNKINIRAQMLDPIRIRLKVMPVKQCPQPKGKNSDFFFIEAAKKSLRNELTQAVDLLKRGLQLNPKHYYCRFNHGVLMFKFGFIVEAVEDFKKLTDSHPQYSWPYYNLAISLVQLGLPSHHERLKRKHTKAQDQIGALNLDTPTQRYEAAIACCRKTFDMSVNDKPL